MSENVTAGRSPKRRWLEAPNKQALVIAAIFATSVITFYILFDAASKIEYFKEILAALMGTLLTAVITTVLLNTQTRSEEIREQNAEVFKRKFDAYSAFMELASRHTADRSLSKDEAVELLSVFHKIGLLGSKDTAEELLMFIEETFIKRGSPTFTIDRVLMVLKNDLFSTSESLEEEDLIDTGSFVSIINTEPEVRDKHHDVIGVAFDKIVRRLECMDPPAEFVEPQVFSDHTLLTFETNSGLSYDIAMTYEIIDDPECYPAFFGAVEINQRLNKQRVIDAARLIGFSYDEQEGSIGFVVDIKTRKKSYVCDGNTVWSIPHFCDCVIDLESKIGGSPAPAKS